MEIKRFNEQVRSKYDSYTESNQYHVFAVFNDEDSEIPDFEIFDYEEEAFNFLANHIYRIYNENGLNLDILDECEDATELIENYEEEVHENHNIKHQLIYYTSTSLNRNAELDGWIKTRRDAKKYNI